MRIPQPHRATARGANMTPMIDVVFLLIIFFLVSSHLARRENHLPVDLPTAATHNPIDLESAALVVSIDASADYFLGGERTDLDVIAAAVAEYRQEVGPSAAIRIRTDGGVPYRYVEPVLRRAALAGVADAAIAVRGAAVRPDSAAAGASP